MNFRHLHYFWVTAKAGGVMRAGEQLHTTPQTLSGQIKLLEGWLGRKLFRKSGRQLELTDDGRVALRYADQIFNLGVELEAAVRQARGGQRVLDFRVGVADSVAKSIAYHLLEPALLVSDPVRLICIEGKFPDLLAQLALQRLDLVVADEPMSRRTSVKAFNHPLGRTAMSFFCAPTLMSQIKGRFPACLNGMPMLIHGASASVRQQFEGWLIRHELQPHIVGEFDDGALMKAFGEAGAGVFVAPKAIASVVCKNFGVISLGGTDDITDQFYAISVERKLAHPAVVAISSSARLKLFAAKGDPVATAPRKRGTKG